MSTKGRDTSIREKRGRSPTLTRKLENGQQETKRRSLSLSRKTEVGQRGRSLNRPSILERKKASTSIEPKKVPTIPWPDRLSRVPSFARNPKKQMSPPKTKSLLRSLDRPTPPSKVMSTKSKSSPQNIISPSVKTSGLMKPKSPVTYRSPLKSKNSVNAKPITNVGSKKRAIQRTKGLRSTVKAIKKKSVISNALPFPQKDQNIVTHEEHIHNVVTHGNNDILHDEVKFEVGGRIRFCEPSVLIDLVLDQEMSKSEICSHDNVSVDGSVINEHAYDHDDTISQLDHVDETFDITSDHLDHPIVDQENQELEDEQVAQEAIIGSTNEDGESEDEDLEHDESEAEEPEDEETEDEHEGIEIEEAEVNEDDVEVPKAEDTTSKVVVKNQEVVMHGKESATYHDVIEKTVIKLREQRKNRVLALAGAFETVISLESESSSPKDLSPKYINSYQ